jgi:hypothetical protein
MRHEAPCRRIIMWFGSFPLCRSPWRKQSQGCNTCILEDRTISRQNTCLPDCHCRLLLPCAPDSVASPDQEEGATVSESGNIKIDSMAGTETSCLFWSSFQENSVPPSKMMLHDCCQSHYWSPLSNSTLHFLVFTLHSADKRDVRFWDQWHLRGSLLVPSTQ